MKLTQKQLILNHLNSGGRLTARQAGRLYGCDRLAARVWDLNNPIRGVSAEIHKEMIRVRGRDGPAYVARYSLI